MEINNEQVISIQVTLVPDMANTYQFEALLDGEVIGKGYTFEWNFGDGNADDIPNPQHTYANPGDYTVSVIVVSLGSGKTEGPAGSETNKNTRKSTKPTGTSPLGGSKSIFIKE